MIRLSSRFIRIAIGTVECVNLPPGKAFTVTTPESFAKAGMPKKQRPSGSKESQKTAGASAVVGSAEGPLVVNTNNSITVRILAKPGAKHNSVTDITSEGVGIQIAAPPVDGEANTELVRYLASVLGLRKSDVSLEKGSRSRNKAVVVSGGLSKEEVLSRLQSEVGK